MTQHPDLPYEQAKNAEYLTRLKAKPPTSAGVGIARSRKWVEPTSIRVGAPLTFHPLVGRIGFDAQDEFLGRACYIGPSRMDEGDLQVVNWDAPVARLFFGTGDDGFTIDGDLAVRRTFDHRVDDIADLDDEWIAPADPHPFEAAALAVPAPPKPRQRRRVPDIAQESQPQPPLLKEAAVPEDEAEAAKENHTNGARAVPRGRDDRSSSVLAGMRAPETVLKKLAAPRANSLRSVLATLQPDQFDVVSRPSGDDLLVQGHPGTGKTVVAAYRAAYLVSPERKEAQAQSVLLIGPTSAYVSHVSGLLRPLDPGSRIIVTHMSAVLDRTVDLKSQWSGGIGGDHNDIDARARQFATLAEKLIKENGGVPSGPTARRDHIKALYALIRSNGRPDRPLSSDPVESAWMRRLPEFEQAVRLRRHLPLMAQITLAFQPIPFTDQFTHLIVDEAQDVSPIEWNVLEQYQRPGGHWTLVGDMNQRRSDATYATWADISAHLGLGDGDEALRQTILRRGYRSTTPILKFADKLLPASARGATSIQMQGPKPSVVQVASLSALIPSAVESVQRLISTYPHGTVAIITVDPNPVIQWLGKQGWRRGGTPNEWVSAGEALRVLVPESARGLEFDGVVVVEPGAFPENLGREGQLYTSLTRANRELAVLWHRDLPDALRKSGRK